MLKEVKKTLNKWIVISIIGLICLVFVFVGVFPTGSEMITGGNYVARIDSETITIPEFNNRLQQTMSQINRKLSKEEEARVVDSVLNQMIQRKILVVEARKVGFLVSDQEVMEAIKEQDYFLNENTKRFDVDQYRTVLAKYGIRPADYEKSVKEDLLRARLVNFMNDRVYVTDDEVRREFEITETQRNIKFVRIPKEHAYEKMQVEAEKLQEYLDNEEKFNLVKNYYYQNIRNYRKEREVCARHIVRNIRNPSKVSAPKEFADLNPTTGNFARLAKEKSDEKITSSKGGDIGCVEKLQIANTYGAAVADELFKLKPGEVSKLIRGNDGWHYFYAYDVKPLKEQKLDAVKEDIARMLLKRERFKEVREINEQTAKTIASAWKAKNADAAASQFGFRAEDSGWFHEMSVTIPGLGRADDIFKAAFSNDSTIQREPTVFESQGTFVVAQVVEKKSPDLDKIKTEKDRIRKYLMNRKRQILLSSWYEQVAKSYEPKIKRNTTALQRFQ